MDTETMSGPPPPPDGPASDRPAGPPGHRFGAGQLLAVVGTVAIVVSLFFSWVRLSNAPGAWRAHAIGIPVQFLFDFSTTARNPNFLDLLIVCAVLCGAGALLTFWFPASRLFVLLGAVLAIVTVVGYGIQVGGLLQSVPASVRVPVLDYVGIGPYVAAAGGLAALVGALIPRPKRRAAAA